MRILTKMFLFSLILLLMAVVINVQAQGVAKVSHDTPAIDVTQNLNTEPGDSFDPNFDPFVSQTEQKNIGSTDDLKLWVLPSNGSTSINTRAPGNHYLYQRTEYLIRASEIAASGFPVGALVSSISFYIATAGVGTQTGTLNIWLMNTADVTYSLGAAWTTTGFTQVSNNPSFTVPISPSGLVWDETFIGGSPFTYTGGGVYVAWEFSGLGPVGTTGTIHYCNTTLTSGLYGQRSNTSLPTTLVASNWRPATRFGTTSFDDVLEVTHVYAMGKLPIPYGLPTNVDIRVNNVTASPATFDVTLEVRDVATNTLEYTATQTGVTLAGNTAASYSFPGWTPAILEDVNIIGIATAATGETWILNNTKTEPAQINDNLFSQFYPYVPGSGYGYTTPGEGIFGVKYYMNGSGIVPSVNIFIYNFAANTGATIFACLLDDAGTIVAQTANYIIQAGDLGTNKNFAFTVPQLFTDEDFYVGIGQTYLSGATQYYPLGIIAENPLRANTFYNFAITGGTPTASTAAWKYMIEAVVGEFVPCDPPTNLFPSNITSTNTTLNWTSGAGLSDVEYGPAGFVQGTGTMVTGTTSPLVIATSPATGYDFYVRDVCAGPSYSNWVLNSFWTFCEDCPGGALAEGEGQLPDGSDGSGINGGCAVGDPLLTLPIAPGQTRCGESNTFINNVGANSRDNDYYVMDLTTPANVYWNVTAQIKGNGLYNMTLFNAGAMDCNISAYATVTTTVGCETGSIDVDVPSGMYYLVARVATATGNLWPYGSGPWQYVMSVDATPLGAPNMDPDPAPISVLVNPGSKYSMNMPIGNIGTYALDYAASTTGTFGTTFFDDFDLYAAGVQLALQVADPTKWTTWSSLPGSTEDPYVSTDVAYSGTNSVLITGANDCVHPFPNYTSGSYRLSFKMFVPAGFDGYFNVLQLFNGANSEWGFQAYFDAGGAGSCDAGGASSGTWTFAYDTWLTNEVLIDLDGDYAEFWFDGNFIVSWQWSTGTFGSGTLKQLSGVNLYAYTGTQTPKFYFDDFHFETAGNDWLTLDGGLGVSGSIGVGSPAINVVLGFDSSLPVGTYTKTINLTTNELGAKTSYAIPVTMMVGYSLSGTVYYGLLNSKPMSTNTTVTCTPGPTVPSGAGGAYTIRPLGNGNYGISGATTKPYGGLQALDAIQVQRFVAGSITFADLQKRAGDVNKSSSVQNLDATFIRRRVSSIAVPQWTAPDWVFDGPFGVPPALQDYPVTIAGSNATLDFRALCSGDVNGSYNPPVE